MQSLIEIGPVILEKKLFFRQYIFSLSLLSPLEKRRGPSFEQTRISFTHGCSVLSLVEIASVVLEKKKMCKVYDKDDNNDDEQRTNCDQKNLT